MSNHKQYWWKRQPGGNTKHDRRDHFREAYVPFSKPMMKQVKSLNDEQRDVSVLRGQH
jgi:hypothetical protein